MAQVTYRGIKYDTDRNRHSKQQGRSNLPCVRIEKDLQV